MSQIDNIHKYDPARIIAHLRSLRNKANLSQEELGAKMNVHRTTVVRWENPDDKAFPTLEDMLKLCNLYDCDLSYLLCEQECTVKDIQAIQDYTGLSERAIRLLHDLKTLEEENPNRRGPLAAVNSIISDSGLEFLAYIQSVIGAKIMVNMQLTEIPESLNPHDMGAISEYENKMEFCRTHLNFTKEEAVEALRRFMQESLQLGKTENALNQKIKELISILMR